MDWRDDLERMYQDRLKDMYAEEAKRIAGKIAASPEAVPVFPQPDKVLYKQTRKGRLVEVRHFEKVVELVFL